MPPLSPRQFVSGLVQQAAFGTAEADSVNFNAANQGFETMLAYPELDSGAKKQEDKLAAGTRSPVSGNFKVLTDGMMPQLVLPDGDARQDELKLLLAMFFQSVTEGATTPYSAACKFNKTAQPDFPANAGFFATAILKDPYAGANQSVKVKDIIAKSLKFSWQPGDDHLLKVGATLVGRGNPTRNANPSGTWAKSAEAFWSFYDIGRATLNDGTAYNMILDGPGSITLDQMVEGVGQASGEVYTFGLGDHLGLFSFVCQHGSSAASALQFEAARAAYLAGTLLTMRIGWGHATAGTSDGDLDFAFTGKITEEPKLDLSGEIAKFTIAGKMFATSSATDLITVTIADALDWGF